MAAPSQLQHLPEPTQARLRSTQIIVSLPQLVSELIQNALDAEANHVDVGVDCEEWSCWVRDDGRGMSKHDLTMLESSGRYGTSKAYTPNSLGEVSTFGFRGEALASVADLSCLEISSRTGRSKECWSVMFKGGKTLYNGAAIRWRRETQGTVVCIRDAFYNLPIRRRSHPSPARTLELIRKEIEAFALVFPHVSFSLENTHKSGTARIDPGRIIKIPKNESTLDVFRHMFGRSLVERVHEVHDKQDDLRIDGFISLIGTPSKTYQYLYINRHILSYCDLHRIIETKINSSSFGNHALDEYNEASPRPEAIRRSPRKVDKKPVYVLNINIPSRLVDNCVEPSKTAVQLQDNNAVASFLHTVVQSFLVQHGFRHEATSQIKTYELQQPRKKRKIVEKGGAGPPAPHDDSSRLPLITWEEKNAGDENNLEMRWTDPRSGITYVVDRRTGNTYPANAEYGNASADMRPHTRRTLPATPLATQVPSETAVETPAWIKQALEANKTYVLSDPRIPSMPLSSTFLISMDEHCHRPHCEDFFPQGDIRPRTQSHHAQFSKSDLRRTVVLSQVDRKFLACVIPSETTEAPATEESHGLARRGNVLALIDQHAADERIRVEQFMRELCRGFISSSTGDEPPFPGTDLKSLDPPVKVLLTRHEADNLNTSSEIQAAFRRWGIHVRLPDNTPPQSLRTSGYFASQKRRRVHEDSGYAQVEITHVPEVVAAKLLSENRLRDLIKSYLIELENPDTLSSMLAYQGAEEQTAWQRAMTWCPQELQDLVDSKACRGAIMFNDPLTLQRCERLVSELCETALPFQCAHGRPSLVPLTCLESEMTAGIPASRHLQPVQWERFTRSRED